MVFTKKTFPLFFLLIINIFLLFNYFIKIQSKNTLVNENSNKLSTEFKDFNKSYDIHLANRSIFNHTISEQVKRNYMKNLLEYLEKWNKSLKCGKSVFQTYIQLLNYTHKMVVEEQWLPPFVNTERPIPLASTLNCSNEVNIHYFNGRRANHTSAYIIDMLVFGFELKILEMRLYELYDVVDEFLIFESNITFKKLPKELFFHENKQRFQRFIDKITLVTPFSITRYNPDGKIKIFIEIDQSDINDNFKNTNINFSDQQDFLKPDFTIEKIARMLPIKYYQKYIRKFDSNNDIFIAGDVDEIPDSNFVNHFKHCEVKRDLYPFSISSTFFIYSFNYLFKSDFPAPDDMYSFIFPNILTIDEILKNSFTRIHQTTLLPQATGCHLNRMLATFVISIYKDISQSDGLFATENYLEVFNNPTIEGYNKFKENYVKGRIQERWVHKVRSLTSFNGNHKIFLPWIVQENKEIYKDFFE